jgi:hypothetical protein
VKVSLKYSNLTIQIDLPEIETNVQKQALNELVKLIHENQNQLIDQICGQKYSRNHPFKRSGSYAKTVITSIGPIRIRVQRITRRTDNATSSPILEQLDIKHRKYSRDLRMKLADFASKMSYSDASIEFNEATGIHVPKRTIHSFVQEIAPQLHEANCKANQPQPTQIVQGDSTQVRALQKREMNNVHVILSQEGNLLHLGVNDDYPKTEAEGLISDNEPGLTNAVDSKWKQLCILHALNYLLFMLWGERMGKIERDQVEVAFKQTLFTLVSSVKKHLLDKDMARLQAKIDKTLQELDDLAVQLQSLGYPKASSFIRRNARFMITFAELALEGVEIPYTNNRMERLMGEVSKRCKGHWRHWSTTGLRNILAIVLTRYTNQTLYDKFKVAYIHNEALL